jgi:hypothetical protein
VLELRVRNGKNISLKSKSGSEKLQLYRQKRNNGLHLYFNWKFRLISKIDILKIETHPLISPFEIGTKHNLPKASQKFIGNIRKWTSFFKLFISSISRDVSDRKIPTKLIIG